MYLQFKCMVVLEGQFVDLVVDKVDRIKVSTKMWEFSVLSLVR